MKSRKDPDAMWNMRMMRGKSKQTAFSSDFVFSEIIWSTKCQNLEPITSEGELFRRCYGNSLSHTIKQQLNVTFQRPKLRE